MEIRGWWKGSLRGGEVRRGSKSQAFPIAILLGRLSGPVMRVCVFSKDNHWHVRDHHPFGHQRALSVKTQLSPSLTWLVVFWGSQGLFPAHPKVNQPWIFIGRTDAEAPIPWPPGVKSQLTGKDPDAGKDWRREEKGVTEDGMIGWHHWLHGHEFKQTLGDSGGQRSLVCCSPWGHKELDTTEQLNNGKTGLVLLCAPWGGESVAPGLQPGSPGLRGRQHRRQWL